MRHAFEYLLMGCGLSLVIAALRLAALIVDLSVPDWLDRVMSGIACAPIAGLVGLIGIALLTRGLS